MSRPDFQKWRHDLRSMITQFDHIAELLAARDPGDTELDALIVTVLRKSQRRLSEQYETVIALEEQSQAQGSMPS